MARQPAGALRASPPAPAAVENDAFFALDNFEDELKRLADANQELLQEFTHQDGPSAASIVAAAGLAPADNEQLEMLRIENAELKLRVQELEALGSGKGEELWQERQREYELLVEEKSEVIRALHQKIQELQEQQESAIGGPVPASPSHSSNLGSSTRLGQAEEILRLKREIEDQRKQLEQDEKDMMSQMRQMEMTMARERAEMARQRQEVQRIQADLAREIEQSSRNPELKERLNSLRRTQDKPASGATPGPAVKPEEQKTSGFFRRIFG